MLLLWLLRSGKLAEMYENNVQQNENPSYKFPNDYELNIRLKQKKKKSGGEAESFSACSSTSSTNESLR